MKRLTALLLAAALVFCLCGCGGSHRVRFLLKPEAEIGAENLETSGAAYQKTVLPILFSDFSEYTCVRVGENIQVDCQSTVSSQQQLDEYLAKNFRCCWLEAFSQDELPVFSSSNIVSAQFETDENGVEQLVLTLDARGTAMFERATINHNKEKLLINLDGLTFGECRMDKWVKDGKVRFSPDAAMTTPQEKQQTIDKIMSAAGLSCRFTVLYGSLL
ncbi:MAG: hypothetical protein IJL87_06905 [Clostridia bacterium]|nr:hypothetical protein [Clostridia bacterium]